MLSLHQFYEKINTPEGKREIIVAFSNIDERDPNQADNFFQTYCVGQWNADRASVIYHQRDYIGRIDSYQDLLLLLKKNDKEKFNKIHKGTPYCFLGWLYFDIGDYEKGVFYIDLAILEDIRMHGTYWNKSPATRLLTLEETNGDVEIHKRLVKNIKELLRLEIEEYKKLTKESKLTSIDNFVKNGLKNPHHRTIVSSLYAYILQQESLQNLMKLKGEESGSIEPFLIHFRKGTIILETILKETYSSLSGLTLANILNDPFVIKDSGLKLLDSGKVGSTLEDLVKVLIPYFDRGTNEPQNKWITVAYRLRNVTSHGLPWSEIIDAATYKRLYQQILFSIFYIIDKKYS
ncbi:MAG: hypothetical protein ACD_13C00110G0007 [uncultured bacterium]|uniref:Uncharacterized protein n=1 Tax=Candidatus Woesebacteria bacterium GW2011_GWA1_40_43 TaxID=1618553 RepID=A0A0G0VKM3_9BACT|nr:MAG: hypothetical protein ACD_13C00110G0007 [uncultured bacterium]KKR51730.1 MAG: hypothetical protein UT88_C0031G0003 [Candidatus Woesebacteria bacterium GW2011_GWD2_40_19]KKR56941.1 MAG: hypothetical protein UT96_C0030G0005 [Candidatus Woesebacteria bacterium GW2011_GWC2_40_30]KKR63327.1 MAG: hypothetical protein UU02_C0027G0004 [Candidatus Woesebacteria bacterium GW2011_GWA1_40_43]HAU65159.1 hypothetical protein [Candidatus Woesebacteria bacterium]